MDMRRRKRVEKEGGLRGAAEEERAAGGEPVELAEGRVPASQAKLDELFLHWMALPEAQTYVRGLVANVKNERPILSITTGGGWGSSVPPVFDGPSPSSSPTGSSIPRNPHLAHLQALQNTHKSSPLRSPTGRSSSPLKSEKPPAGDVDMSGPQEQVPALESAHSPGNASPPTMGGPEAAKSDHKAAVGPFDETAPASRPSPNSHAIPRFWTASKCSEPLVVQCQSEARDIDSFFMTREAGVGKDDFGTFTRLCGYPSFFNGSLFDKIGPVEGLVTGEQAKKWWDEHCKHKDCETRLFELLRGEGKNYVTREDWKVHLNAFLNTHPGLEFLKATPEFQERYLECVVERIYYTVNKADNGKLSLSEILKSNLVAVLLNLDEEPDINQILDYFSYEHFYVCYCNFWELDTDHDFLLDKEDLIKLGNYSLTYRVVDRIFAGAPRPVSSGVPDKLGYLDFIWLLLSEEDKNSDTAIRYWFRTIDLESDGFISRHDMDFFYKEQLHRMDCLAQEVVQFEDMLCQMTDMVKPACQGHISMLDLKRCKQPAIFFNVLFNLTKFIQGDQKDPAQIFHERATPELTDWDRYAKLEYSRLAMEDEGEADDAELGSLDMETGLGGIE